MKYFKKITIISALMISNLSFAGPRDPGNDYRPGYDCFHNNHKYTTVPAYIGDVCPAPPIYLDSQGMHIPNPSKPYLKHTVEDCVVTSSPAPRPGS